jgi:hypothetical protein
MRSLNPSLLSQLVAVGLPFYRSEARGRALGGMVLLVVLPLTINSMKACPYPTTGPAGLSSPQLSLLPSRQEGNAGVACLTC